MRNKITAILVFLLLITGSMPVYYIYRTEYIEKGYIEQLAAKNAKLRPMAERLNREQSPDSGKLKNLFNEIIARDSSIAALALTDRMERLRFMVKNDALLTSARIVDELVKDIKTGKVKQPNGNSPVIKNYNGSDWLSDKLYIFTFSSQGQSTIAVYSFKADRMMKIRLALEVTLLMSGILILTSIIILIMKKAGILTEPEPENIRTIVIGERSTKPSPEMKNKKTIKEETSEKQPVNKKNRESAVEINIEELSPIYNIAEITEKSSSLSTTSSKNNADTLNKKVFSLFRKIYQKMSPENVSLYIKRMEGTLSKTYELKGKSLIKIDSLTFDSVNISELEKELKPGANISGNGEIVRIPLMDGKSIIGLIVIREGSQAPTIDISGIRSDISNISDEIKDYIITNNIITDRETGFYSSACFLCKLGESINSAVRDGGDFRLLLINIFKGIDADRKQKDLILKVIHPVLKKIAGEENEIFLHNDFIYMILHKPAGRECENMKKSMIAEISKFRLKISDDNIIRLKPQSIIRSSADSDDIRNILSETEGIAAELN